MLHHAGDAALSLHRRRKRWETSRLECLQSGARTESPAWVVRRTSPVESDTNIGLVSLTAALDWCEMLIPLHDMRTKQTHCVTDWIEQSSSRSGEGSRKLKRCHWYLVKRCYISWKICEPNSAREPPGLNWQRGDWCACVQQTSSCARLLLRVQKSCCMRVIVSLRSDTVINSKLISDTNATLALITTRRLHR